jgi:hypothetical protein
MGRKTEERIKKIRKQRWGKRKKRIKVVILLLSLFFIVYGIYFIKTEVTAFLWNLDIFEVKQVRITPRKVAPVITELIAIENGKNLLFLDIEEIRNKILTLQEVENCRIKKDFPSALHIEVYLRSTWIILKKGEEKIFIDKNGNALPFAESASRFMEVSGIDFDSSGVKIDDMGKIEVLKEIDKWYNFHNIFGYFKVNKIVFYKPTQIELAGDDKKILFATENIKEKMENLKEVLVTCGQANKNWQYIDMRFEDPVVKFEDK